MPDNQDKTHDPHSTRHPASHGSAVPTGGVEGATAFITRISPPAAQEFNLLLHDRISPWRANNAIAIANKAEKMLDTLADASQRHALPRLVMSILDRGSWSDSDEVRELWAGLLAASCTHTGDDDSNVIFIDLLSQLTSSEIRLLTYFCQTAKKTLTPVRSIAAFKFDISLQELLTVSRVDDFHRIDRELDHLRSLGLIDGGFHVQFVQCYLSPTTLALQMYARCNGYADDPAKFYGLQGM
jgi:hypothetical protein